MNEIRTDENGRTYEYIKYEGIDPNRSDFGLIVHFKKYTDGLEPPLEIIEAHMAGETQ